RLPAGQMDFKYHPQQPQAELAQTNGHASLGAAGSLSGLELNLLGQHQGLNEAVALAALEQLRQTGWEISETAIRAGLRQTSLPARVEIVRRQPTIILDAAHNVASIKALVATLQDCFPPSPRTF